MKTRILSGIIILATFFTAIYRITHSAADIVLHWDFSGDVTSYGSKNLLIILPLISLGLTLLIAYYEKNPNKLYYPFKYKDTEFNNKAMEFYCHVITIIITLLLLYITICSAQYFDLQPIVVILFLLLIFVLYVYTRRTLEK